MRYLRLTSFGVTALGALAVLAAVVFDLGPAVVISGILLAWAGVVKIIVVYLWTRIAGLDSDRHNPIPPV